MKGSTFLGLVFIVVLIAFELPRLTRWFAWLSENVHTWF